MVRLAVKCGTCAWADHEFFYPQGLPTSQRLQYYAQWFPVVEVDSPFYRIPSVQSAQKWNSETPPHFVFDVKAHRTLTYHDRPAVEDRVRDSHHEEFEQVVSVLRAAGKLGALLFQFPPWFVNHKQHRKCVEEIAVRYQGYRVAVEFRHRSWWEQPVAESTVAWLRALNVVNVVCDEPQIGLGCIPFVAAITHPDLVIFRMHGRNTETWYLKRLTSSSARFDYLYAREELSSYLATVSEWQSQASEVHILMNNNQADYAVVNARDWQSLLHQSPSQAAPTSTGVLPLF